MYNRVQAYDLVRVFAIFFVFLAHILNKQLSDGYGLLFIRSFSPGLTMSLLGFISAALLTKSVEPYGEFLIRRISRLYTSLFICLTAILILHSFQAKDVISQHTLWHYLGLTGFLGIFLVKNRATVGPGLWFVTAIMIMYLLLPFLIIIFEHQKRKLHFVLMIALFTILDFFTYGTQSFWNVCISFSLGVYLSTNGQLKDLHGMRLVYSFLISTSLIILCALSTARILPYFIRGLLFAFYPLGFIPLFFAISNHISEKTWQVILLLTSMSYEYYILHFYFINKGFYELFPENYGLLSMIMGSFIITFFLAFICSRVSNYLRKMELNYLLNKTQSEQLDYNK